MKILRENECISLRGQGRAQSHEQLLCNICGSFIEIAHAPLRADMPQKGSWACCVFSR